MASSAAWIHDYFGEVSACYGEVNGSRPLRERLRAIGHIGVLRQITYSESDGGHWCYDVAAGLAGALAEFDLQATWATASSDAAAKDACSPWQCGSRNAGCCGSHTWWRVQVHPGSPRRGPCRRTVDLACCTRIVILDVHPADAD
jgi:hypothetical protein